MESPRLPAAAPAESVARSDLDSRNSAAQTFGSQWQPVDSWTYPFPINRGRLAVENSVSGDNARRWPRTESWAHPPRARNLAGNCEHLLPTDHRRISSREACIHHTGKGAQPFPE